MAQRLEDYALLSDCHSSALVGKNGSIDWLGFPCFDSAACFASLLGTDENGRWLICPQGTFKSDRKYVEDSVVLETTFYTDQGSVKLTDCMLKDDKDPTLIRLVEGLEGSVEMNMDLAIRFEYGSIVPWVRRNNGNTGIHAIAGPEALVLYSPVKLRGKNYRTCATFTVNAGEKKSFELMWYPSHKSIPPKIENPEEHVQATIDNWRSWLKRCHYKGFDEASVKRSLLTLKALTYAPTGAIIAAPTTSLPEDIGGTRNWDYRFSWIRDSSFTLYALIKGGHEEEALRWKEWLLRAVAGTPSQVNIMYGIRGERRLTELELHWLPGYENSRPVRIGNAAYNQFQLDVFGELILTAHLGRKNGIAISEDNWRIEQKMVKYVCEHWQDPDEGIWEVRGGKRHFTHSKVMAWVALEYATESAKSFHLPGEIEEWEKIRDEIHKDICEKGFDQELNAFVQSYGSKELDASLLMMAHVKFLPITDYRIIGTVEAIQKKLTRDGHVLRYLSEKKVDGLPGTEGSFIACSFWLVDNLRMMGRKDEAMELYQKIKCIKNDVGLYAEEYAPELKRMVGNFPQAFTHIAEVISAMGFQEAE